jgi:putative Mn2+ efflux pump MntP
MELILTSIGVSLDVFAVAVCEGATYAKLGKKKILNISCLFGSIQTLFMIIGSVIAAIPFFHDGSSEITKLNYSISFIIFIFLGFHMLNKAFYKKELLEQRKNDFSYKYIFLLAVAAGADALIVGFGISLLDTQILFAILIMIIITILCAILGLQSGYRLGFEHRKGAYITGGLILFIMGIEILIKHI